MRHPPFPVPETFAGATRLGFRWLPNLHEKGDQYRGQTHNSRTTPSPSLDAPFMKQKLRCIPLQKSSPANLHTDLMQLCFYLSLSSLNTFDDKPPNTHRQNEVGFFELQHWPSVGPDSVS